MRTGSTPEKANHGRYKFYLRELLTRTDSHTFGPSDEGPFRRSYDSLFFEPRSVSIFALNPARWILFQGFISSVSWVGMYGYVVRYHKGVWGHRDGLIAYSQTLCGLACGFGNGRRSVESQCFEQDSKASFEQREVFGVGPAFDCAVTQDVDYLFKQPALYFIVPASNSNFRVSVRAPTSLQARPTVLTSTEVLAKNPVTFSFNLEYLHFGKSINAVSQFVGLTFSQAADFSSISLYPSSPFCILQHPSDTIPCFIFNFFG